MGMMSGLPKPVAIEPSDGTAIYDARALVTNGVKALIVLDGQIYTLRITRAGKLILTK
ncbi:hemin uptake protein hemP [Albidovulum inexpectatum]|uniref:Hemin uptake protein hemP n=2 Tax=Albidovulum inexpectatum TaxID=196587 RepID=A0A2S5JH52_9RHOB|nr:hemin uptake protein hemP [Albidovulum inexpectatum]